LNSVGVDVSNISSTYIEGVLELPLTDNLNSNYFKGGSIINDSTSVFNNTWIYTYEENNVKVRNLTTMLPAITLVTIEDVKQVSAAFNQNMQAQYCYIVEDELYLYWFDSLINNYTTSNISSDITSCYILLDETRDNLIDTSNNLLYYIKNNNLYLRKQKERFTIEHLAYANLPSKSKIYNIQKTIDTQRLQFIIKT